MNYRWWSRLRFTMRLRLRCRLLPEPISPSNGRTTSFTPVQDLRHPESRHRAHRRAGWWWPGSASTATTILTSRSTAPRILALRLSYRTRGAVRASRVGHGPSARRVASWRLRLSSRSLARPCTRYWRGDHGTPAHAGDRRHLFRSRRGRAAAAAPRWRAGCDFGWRTCSSVVPDAIRRPRVRSFAVECPLPRDFLTWPSFAST